MPSTDHVDALLADLQGQLAADELFSDVPVLVDDETLESEIVKALGTITGQAGKSGVCAIIMQPTGTDANISSIGGPLDWTFTIRFIANQQLNNDPTTGTGKKTRLLARRALAVLKLFQPVGYATPLRPVAPGLHPVVIEEIGPIGHEIKFTTREADPAYTKVALPSITNNAGTITLACATAGAAIYYTTDETHPNHRNTAATLYTAPFPAASDTVIRARATKTGSLASDVNSLTVS
jgi:hypothetical protein